MSIRPLTIIACCLLLAAACKKDQQAAKPLPIPAITSIDKPRAQSGDTLMITGTNLQRDALRPVVLINGRNATVLTSTPEKVSVIVPSLTKSGPVLLLLGNASATGPDLTIDATPVITGFEPRFLQKGDTLLIHGEHFAALPADNQVSVGGRQATIVSASTSLLKILVPQNADTGSLSIGVYNGALQPYKGGSVLLRNPTYPAQSILEWLSLDPGFSFIYNYIDKTQAGLTGQLGRDVLMPYLTGEKKGTLFIPNNNFAYNRGLTTAQQVINSNPWYMIYWGLLSVTHAAPVDYASLQTDIQYPSELTGEVIIGWVPGTRDYFSISEVNGEKFVTTLSYGYPMGSYKILREIDINGSIFYEIDTLPNFESQPGP